MTSIIRVRAGVPYGGHRGTMSVSAVDLRERLERFLTARLRECDGVRVVRLDGQPEGFSQETFSLDVELRRGAECERRGYVIKREPVAGLLEPYDLEPEFRVLHALSGDRVLSPPTPWFERDPAVLERPFYVMERLPGEVPIPAVGADGRLPFTDAEREALGPQVVEVLARLHAIDWRARGFDFLDVPAAGTAVAVREIARWETRIAQARLVPDPVVVEALLWLHAHVPATDEVTIVHGDYRLGNWLVEGTGAAVRLAGVLDWELVHLGDPLEDVAWCMSPLWRAQTPWAAALLEPEAFLARYAAATGRAADPERLRFYDVLALVKMIAIEMTGIRAFLDRRTTDLRMAVFDHQVPFLELLLAVLRGWVPLPGG